MIYNRENNVLMSEYTQYRHEMESLTSNISSSVGMLASANDLLHFTEKIVMLDDFDAELFDRYVDRIIVISREEASFELKCGLSLHERM